MKLTRIMFMPILLLRLIVSAMHLSNCVAQPQISNGENNMADPLFTSSKPRTSDVPSDSPSLDTTFSFLDLLHSDYPSSVSSSLSAADATENNKSSVVPTFASLDASEFAAAGGSSMDSSKNLSLPAVAFPASDVPSDSPSIDAGEYYAQASSHSDYPSFVVMQQSESPSLKQIDTFGLSLKSDDYSITTLLPVVTLSASDEPSDNPSTNPDSFYTQSLGHSDVPSVVAVPSSLPRLSPVDAFVLISSLSDYPSSVALPAVKMLGSDIPSDTPSMILGEYHVQGSEHSDFPSIVSVLSTFPSLRPDDAFVLSASTSDYPSSISLPASVPSSSDKTSDTPSLDPRAFYAQASGHSDHPSIEPIQYHTSNFTFVRSNWPTTVQPSLRLSNSPAGTTIHSLLSHVASDPYREAPPQVMPSSISEPSAFTIAVSAVNFEPSFESASNESKLLSKVTIIGCIVVLLLMH